MRSTGLSLLLLLSLAFAEAARSAPIAVEDRAFLEIDGPAGDPFVGQRILLRLRIGVDREFFGSNVVPLFRRAMDIPVQVHAPWLASLPGATVLDADRNWDRPRLGLALDDEVIEAERLPDRIVDGRAYTVVEIRRSYLPERTGDLVVQAPRLRFAYGTRFEEDFVNGRRALDRREALVMGEALTLRIRPWPEAGRPEGFQGAVGRFSVEAEARPLEVETGQVMTLVLRISGEGNLTAFDTPRFAGLDGFHVYGSIDDRGDPVRTIEYELTPLDASRPGIPALPFVFLDPGPPAIYRIAHTRPIPLTLRGETVALPTDDAARPSRGGAAGDPPSKLWIAPVALGLVAVVGMVLLLWLRGRSSDPIDPEEARALEASAVFRERVDSAEADVAEAFTNYLASRLRCRPASVIAPDLPGRLRSAGVPADLAARTAALVEDLVASRYGGTATAESTESARRVVADLESSFG